METPKTDFEVLTAMLKRANIPFTILGTETTAEVVVEEGYVGFSSIFTFKADGSLETLEAGES